MTSNFLASVDAKGKTFEVEIRPDGFFNATKMCSTGGKAFAAYERNQTTREFLKELGKDLGCSIDDLVDCKRGCTGGTWVHQAVRSQSGTNRMFSLTRPLRTEENRDNLHDSRDVLFAAQVAINLATWISPKVAVFVTKLATRYLAGELTTEESQAAAAAVAQAFGGGSPPAQLVEWHKQRDEGRQATARANRLIQEATGNRAGGWDYAKIHDAVNWAATGRKTKDLRAELAIRGTPRNHMAAPQLSIVAYVEAMAGEKVGEKRRALGADVAPSEAVAEAGCLAYKAHDFTRGTGGHALPLLAEAPPTLAQVGKALGAAVPTKRQRATLERAAMRTAAALPAPPAKPISDYFRTVPAAVPERELDLYD